MNRREKLAVYLVVQFVAVAVLAAVVGRMLGRFPFGDPFTRPVATTLPTWVAMRTLEAAGVVLLLAYLGALVAVVGYGRSLVDGVRYWTAAGLALCSLPVLAAALVAGWYVTGFTVGRLLAVAALVGGVVLFAVAVAGTLDLLGDGTDATDENAATRLAFAGVVCLGLTVGVVGVAGGADVLVDERYGGGTPQTAFATTYEPVNETHGVLTIRHDGGDAVPREELFVRGTGIVGVDGVDQTAPGPWAGETLRRDSGDRNVVAGNATTVGVRADCEVLVVYQREGGGTLSGTTLDVSDCPASDAE
jgi:hypothetical protein